VPDQVVQRVAHLVEALLPDLLDPLGLELDLDVDRHAVQRPAALGQVHDAGAVVGRVRVALEVAEAHSFYVESEDGARVLHTGSPGGLWDFHAAAGRPASSHTLPPVEPMDVERLTALASQHELEILGPPLSA
jgi:hypothetical protein